MSENLLRKLEERVAVLIAELEESRLQLHQVRDELNFLRTEKEEYQKKLHSILAMLGTVDEVDMSVMAATS